MNETAATVQHEFHIDWGVHGILCLLANYDFKTVLDIGSGAGEHSRFLRHFGKEVFSVDFKQQADYTGDFLDIDFDRQFDAIWCSHVLEHQRNVGVFLDKMYQTLADDGILAISVPVHPRQRLVSGHITSWNAGLLCYNLIMAGFDCHDARFKQDADLSLIVRKKAAPHTERDMSAAWGAVEELAAYFPFAVKQGSEAEILEHNWGGTNYHLPDPAVAGPIKLISKNL